MTHVEVYRVSVGFRIDDETCDRILAQGLMSTTYTDPIYISKVVKTETSTIFTVYALSKSSARAFKNALMEDLGSLESFDPQIDPNADPPEPPREVWSRVGQWTKTVGNATTTISGLPGEPKGIVLWGSGLAGATLGTFSMNGGVVFGFSNGTENRDLAYAAQHNQVTSNANRSIGKKAFHLIDPTGDASTHIKGDCTVSFGASSFNLNWSVTTLGTVGNYFVFGGDDISSVLISDQQVGTTSSGRFDYELGDRYNFGLMLYPFIDGGLPWPTAETGHAGALHSISAQGGPHQTRSWTTCIGNADDMSPSMVHALQKRLYTLSGMSEEDEHEQQFCKFRGWTDSGFTLEWFNAPTAADFIFTGMYVQGGLWDAGHFYQPTAPGNVFTLLMSRNQLVQGLMGFSINKHDVSDEGHAVEHAYFSIGGADNVGGKGCSVYGGRAVSSPTDEVSLVASDKFMKYIGE